MTHPARFVARRLLSDYGIQVPALLQLKVSNTIRLRVDLTAYRNRG